MLEIHSSNQSIHSTLLQRELAPYDDYKVRPKSLRIFVLFT